MELDDIFGGLPYGFSDFDLIKDRLIDCRAKARLPEGARTVISVLFPYYLGEEFYKAANVSRYAVSEDYHIVTAELLNAAADRLRERFPDNVFEVFIDNSPLPEVRCAVNAGLGCLGKNSLFINETYGSWVFLGEIVTDRHFPAFLQKEMHMIAHQAVRIQTVAAGLFKAIQQFEKIQAVLFIMKDLLFIDPPQHNMINPGPALLSGCTWHTGSPASIFICMIVYALFYQSFRTASTKRRQRTVPCLLLEACQTCFIEV